MSILEVNDLSLSFGKFRVLSGVSFAVEQGEIFGIAGPNGAGKTTLFNTITGFCHGSGRITFEKKRIDRFSPHRVCRHGIARTWQVPELFTSLTVEDNVRVELTSDVAGVSMGEVRRARLPRLSRSSVSKAGQTRGSDNLNLFGRR